MGWDDWTLADCDRWQEAIEENIEIQKKKNIIEKCKCKSCKSILIQTKKGKSLDQCIWEYYKSHMET